MESYKNQPIEIKQNEKTKMKRERKLNLLKRDSYRCGIHLGGCGKKITLEETSIDHITPQNITKKDNLVKIKRRYKRRTKESLANGLFNLQPMCSKCNNSIKKGTFPPRDIIKRCSNKCCEFIYHKEKNTWYLVFSHYILKDDDNPTYEDGSPKGKLVFFTIRLEETSVKFSDGTYTEKKYIYYGNNKKKNISFEITKHGGLVYKSDVGGALSELDMIKNNQRYSEQEIADSRKNLLHEINRLGW